MPRWSRPTAIASAAMRALTPGFPKLIVRTLASGNTAHYVGTKDIAEQLVAQSVAGKIVALENMIDKKAMRERLSVALTELGAL